jgi:hypothetical protein
MAGGIYQVQYILLALPHIVYLYGVALDGDALFTFQVHIIEYLRLHIPAGYGFGKLQKAVGQGTFTVVYMGDDTEIANVLHI